MKKLIIVFCVFFLALSVCAEIVEVEVDTDGKKPVVNDKNWKYYGVVCSKNGKKCILVGEVKATVTSLTTADKKDKEKDYPKELKDFHDRATPTVTATVTK